MWLCAGGCDLTRPKTLPVEPSLRSLPFGSDLYGTGQSICKFSKDCIDLLVTNLPGPKKPTNQERTARFLFLQRVTSVCIV